MDGPHNRLLTRWEAPRRSNVRKEDHDQSTAILPQAMAHAGARAIAYKAAHIGYYWPTMYTDATQVVNTCLITEYLVNISKRHAFWSLNEDILKITILTTNTPYPSRKIRRIRTCTHQIPQRKEVQYAVSRNVNTPY
ncbi:hypothetical protein Tco_0556844 [Tanacetum coccineum]